MGRYTEAKCRLCRREGAKLFLKGIRCDTVKCGLVKKESPPGMRRRFRKRPSGYAMMLREVQKVKRYYGLLDKQFWKTFKEASRMKGNTGDKLLILLERRLDNVVTLMGFSMSRAHARQLITHGHITINGRRATKPSCLVYVGDTVAPKARESIINMVTECLQARPGREVAGWLEVKEKPPQGKVLSLPAREDVSIPVEGHLIVEFGSR